MAGESQGPTYHGPNPFQTPLSKRLAKSIAGEVRSDDYTRQLFATDASLYREVPKTVVFPASKEDVVTTVTTCADEGVPVLPRGAGTSLAGQSVNEAVVLDFTRYMDDIISIDTNSNTATVQPGVILDELNKSAGESGLTFAPDPAAKDRSTIGGAIGNNSAGAHSLAYGPTDEYLVELEVVLADGTVTTLGPTPPSDIADQTDESDLSGTLYDTVLRLLEEEESAIEAAYPRLERNVAGYNLDALLQRDEREQVNLARLIAGSEGTLGIILEATVQLVEEPEAKGAVLLSYDDFQTAMADVADLLEYEPAAIESIDAPLLDKARAHPKFAERANVVPDEAAGVLLVEVFGASVEEVQDDLDAIAGSFGPDEGDTIDVKVTTDVDERDRYWALRKSALPLMLSDTSDEKHIGFVEDTAIPAPELPSFIDAFQSVLEDNDTFASFYGHAGPGVLHVRPLIDVTSSAGRDRMRNIAETVFELTMDHGGTISGEHGDGRVRTEFSRRQYPEEVIDLFHELKEAADPQGILNPGPITGDVKLDANHRIEPDDTVNLPFEPSLAWENENGLRGMVELCHGCGGCRSTQDLAGGIMCPTYRASQEEIASTRGRANLLREAIRGNLPTDTLFDPRFEAEVLDLCIGCKGCLHDCPSSVDLATLKTELRHQRHRQRGTSRRERVFGDFPRLAKWGSLAAPFSNWIAKIPGTHRLLSAILGLSPQRPPPSFAPTAFTEWADGRIPSITSEESSHAVTLVPDAYTNYLEPSVGIATVEILEAAGVSVTIRDDLPPIGRAAYSQGFIEDAREYAETILDDLSSVVDDGQAVIVPEPSAAAMIQNDYQHLVGAQRARPLAETTYTPLAFLDTIDATVPVDPSPEPFTVHDHCHQQSIGHGGSVTRVLSAHGYTVDTIDSGCCGMAGSFGYQREHYDLSLEIADILLEQLESNGHDAVLATGTSCRTQLEHVAPDQTVEHPVIRLADDLQLDT